MFRAIYFFLMNYSAQVVSILIKLKLNVPRSIDILKWITIPRKLWLFWLNWLEMFRATYPLQNELLFRASCEYFNEMFRESYEHLNCVPHNLHSSKMEVPWIEVFRASYQSSGKQFEQVDRLKLHRPAVRPGRGREGEGKGGVDKTPDGHE